MDSDDLMQELRELIELLGWDYDSFSNSGKETYDKIASIMAKLTQ